MGEGTLIKNNLVELISLCSLGNSKEKHRNAEGIIPAIANPILTHNNRQKRSSLIKCTIRTLNVQPASPQESKENAILTRLKVDLFEKANTPNPRLIKTVNKRIEPMRIIFESKIVLSFLFQVLTYN